MDNLLSRIRDKYVFQSHAKSVDGEVPGCHGFEEVFSFRVTMIVYCTFIYYVYS